MDKKEKQLLEARKAAYKDFKENVLPTVVMNDRKYVRNAMKKFLGSNRIAWMWNLYINDLV